MFFVLISSLIRPMDISTSCLSACHSLLCLNDIESACSKICTCLANRVYDRLLSSIFQGDQLAEGFEPMVPGRIRTHGTRKDSNPRYPEGFEPPVPERIPTPGTRKNSNPRYPKGFEPTVPERIRTHGTRKDSNPRYPEGFEPTVPKDFELLLIILRTYDLSTNYLLPI